MRLDGALPFVLLIEARVLVLIRAQAVAAGAAARGQCHTEHLQVTATGHLQGQAYEVQSHGVFASAALLATLDAVAPTLVRWAASWPDCSGVLACVAQIQLYPLSAPPQARVLPLKSICT
jgi:hypothetical protein